MSLSREPLCQLSESPHSPEQSTHISSLHTGEQTLLISHVSPGLSIENLFTLKLQITKLFSILGSSLFL